MALNPQGIAATTRGYMDSTIVPADRIVPQGFLGYNPSATPRLSGSDVNPWSLGVIEILSSPRRETVYFDLYAHDSGLQIRVQETQYLRAFAPKAKMWYLVGLVDNCPRNWPFARRSPWISSAI